MAAPEEELDTEEKEISGNKLEVFEPNQELRLNPEIKNEPYNEQPPKEVEEVKAVVVNAEEIKESILETAQPGDVFSNNSAAIPRPLNLSWSFGYNSTLPVHNISYSDKKMMFYASNQTGVLYDCDNHKQHLLQGHGNPISCTAASNDRRWLVTTDIGYNPLLIVWDSYTAVPVRTFFDELGQGVIAVAVSYDSKYIATLRITMPQIVSIWDWTDERDTPIHSTTLPLEHGLQTFITFSQKDSNLLVSNSEETAIFFKWDDKGLKFHTTPITDKDFNKSVGYLSQTVFVPGNRDCAITATSLGYGIVWETTDIHQDNVDFSSLRIYHKSPIKLMVLHDVPISTITSYKQYIVTGDMEGQIKFHDINLTLINWYDRLNCGSIVSISFAFDLTIAKQTNLSQYPLQSTLNADPFVIPNFVVSSSTAIINHITSNGSIQDTIVRESDSGVPCVSAHPTDSTIVIASNDSTIKLWNYEKKIVIVTRSFSGKSSLTSVQFDPSGEFIGIGFSDGEVRVVCSVTLKDRAQPFHYSTDPITVIAFSSGPKIYMAATGLDMTTSVFVLSATQSWEFFARRKDHYKKILSLIFGVSPETGHPRLLSLSEDRHIVEYDLANSSIDDLRLLSIDKMEQSAVPTAITWYPPLSKESFILTANNQLKLKLYNSSTKMCRRTLLGPTYGSSLKKIAVLPSASKDNSRYMAYITKEKVGLLILPHDGNPHNTMSLTAHSGQVTDLAISYDGRYVFSAGGEDCTVNMWKVDTTALDIASKLGGPELEPFYSVIEGGREGSFFAELEQFFYYAQIKGQSSNTVETRSTSLTIPLVQIPFVMRAIGYYPSEQEIENMLNEVKFSRYAESGEYVSQIDLADFIKLYINHKPVHGLTPNMFAEAFKNLGQIDFESKRWKIDRSHLLTILQERGEHLTEADLVEHLMTLLGCCENPEIDGVYVEKPDDVLLNDIPPLISAQEFVEEIVGLSN